ncbi:hypothetical protein BJ165DRAFT_187494 [Panaeolus papilionaceus]|nr:hypothetical protein BJ165DRAFT_187494 [Panaeolus papilionaceus]
MSLSPIEHLYEDVILEIVVQLVLSTTMVTDYRQYPPWVLRQVCSRWRGLCSQHSWFWNDIRIALVDSPNVFQVASTILSISNFAGHLPLRLRFYHRPNSSRYVHKPIDTFISQLIGWLGHWSRRDQIATLEFQLKFIFKVVPTLVEQPPFLGLRTLLLKGRHSWSSNVDVDQNISQLLQRCPELTTVSYRNNSLSVMGTGLASPPKIWPQLRSVDLGYFLDVEQWLDMLRAGDHLEEAFVYLMRSKGLDSPYNTQPLTTHHALRGLAIVFTACDTDCLQPLRLSYLPNLQHLQLFLFKKPQLMQPYGLRPTLPSMTELTVHQLWHLDLGVFIDFLRCNPQLEGLHLSLSIRFCARLFDFLTIHDDEILSWPHSVNLSHPPPLPLLRSLTLELAKVAVPASMYNRGTNGGEITFTASTHRSLLRMIDSRSGSRANGAEGEYSFLSGLAPLELVVSHRALVGSVRLEQVTICYLASSPSHNVKAWKKAAVFAGMMADKLKERRGKGTSVHIEVAHDFGYMDSFRLGRSHWGVGRG